MLQQRARTVDELARSLALTPNGIRAHLAALEYDGLVERTSVRRAKRGKPAHLYRVTEGAGAMLSSAYPAVAKHFLDAVDERFPSPQVMAALRVAGRRLAQQLPASGATIRVRALAATRSLNELGGAAELSEQGSTLVITSRACPLSVMTGANPTACLTLEAFVGEIVGAPARHRCDHTDRPRCRFEIAREQTAPDASGDPGE
jgi:predicted ArsR family transcriptional regulator